MTPSIAAIAVAFIGGLFGLLGELVRRDNKRTRAQNTEQHAEGRAAVEQVLHEVRVISARQIIVAEQVAEIDSKVDAISQQVAVHEFRLDRHDERTT